MTTVWTGLAVGSLYALVALGFQLPLTQAGVFNFAQGVMYVVGAYAVWALNAEAKLPLLLAVPLSVVICGVIGGLSEIFAIRPLKNARGHAALITTVGASVLLEGLLLVAFGDTPQTVDFLGSGSFSWLGGQLQAVDIALIATALAATAVLGFVGSRTMWGISGKASIADADAAVLRGVDGKRIRLTAFIAAGALAGLVGPLVGAKASVNLTLAPTLTVFGFVALAVGGFGSYLGCLLGGLVVGLVEAVTQRYAGGGYPTVAVFVLLLVVLMARPSGFFGTRDLRTI
jgi:branched-chain amino acid transport system permease protein